VSGQARDAANAGAFARRATPPGAILARFSSANFGLGLAIRCNGPRVTQCRGRPVFLADAVATAKRDLEPGEILDGEGGYTVVGKLVRAEDSLAEGALPLGLAHGFKVLHPVAQGQPVRWQDVAYDGNLDPVRARRDMEAAFAPQAKVAA
jgi:hypothetical protein